MGRGHDREQAERPSQQPHPAVPDPPGGGCPSLPGPRAGTRPAGGLLTVGAHVPSRWGQLLSRVCALSSPERIISQVLKDTTQVLREQ